jgi:hypothetical protein
MAFDNTESEYKLQEMVDKCVVTEREDEDNMGNEDCLCDCK